MRLQRQNILAQDTTTYGVAPLMGGTCEKSLTFGEQLPAEAKSSYYRTVQVRKIAKQTRERVLMMAEIC